MAIEIERKFLVRNDSWRQGSQRSARIEQGYFCRTPLLRARIRIFGDKGYITLKSEPGKLTRYEFEYEIPKKEATEIIGRFSIEPIITTVMKCFTQTGFGPLMNLKARMPDLLWRKWSLKARRRIS